MFCAICGNNVQGDVCANCGARIGQAPAPAMVSSTAGLMASAVPATDVGLRAGAYLIDVIPAIIAAVVLGWIPILGGVLLGFILGAYWLLRDIKGASLGKMLLGLHVVRKDGAPSTEKQRILRNITIAAGPLLLVIPLGGLFIAPIVAFILIVTEIVLLLSKKERLGDMLAGTTVVKKAPAAQAAIA